MPATLYLPGGNCLQWRRSCNTQTPLGPCMGCPSSPSGLEFMLSQPGPEKPLAGLWPSDCLLATWPGGITTQGKDGKCALPMSDMSRGCCHGRHFQSSTMFFVMELRQYLPHYPHPWAPGQMGSGHSPSTDRHGCSPRGGARFQC